MKTYRVEWSIDVDAESPEAAALEAADYFRSGECPFFDVIEFDGTGESVPVNIDELDAGGIRRSGTG